MAIAASTETEIRPSSRPEVLPIALRDAVPGDHPALMALEGTAANAGAAMIQARTHFFARTQAYPVARVLVAERGRSILGVLCVTLSSVRVGGEACEAGYIFNVRVEPSRQGHGLGPIMMEAATQWLEDQGARYVTGLIKTTNVPSMKMVTRLGWEIVDRFDYLVLDLIRFPPDPQATARPVSIWDDPVQAAARFDSVFFHHFVPRRIDRELFAPRAFGGYAGSGTASVADGNAWLSLWDDRHQRGLDPRGFPALKAYDVTLQGPGGFRAFTALAGMLRTRGLRRLLMPVRLDDQARGLLAPYTEEFVDFNYVVKPLNGAPTLPPGPVYFDVRH